MDWTQHIKMDYAQNLRKCPNKAKQTIFRIFQNSKRNLVMHFHKTVYTDIFHYFIRFHWVSEIYIPKCFLLHTFCKYWWFSVLCLSSWIWVRIFEIYKQILNSKDQILAIIVGIQAYLALFCFSPPFLAGKIEGVH